MDSLRNPEGFPKEPKGTLMDCLKNPQKAQNGPKASFSLKFENEFKVRGFNLKNFQTNFFFEVE